MGVAVRYGNRGAIHVLLDHGARPDIDDEDEVLDLDHEHCTSVSQSEISDCSDDEEK